MSGAYILIILAIVVICEVATLFIIKKSEKKLHTIGELFIDENAFEGTIVKLNFYDDNFNDISDKEIVKLKIVKNVDLTEP